MTKLQKENLEHTEANLHSAKARFTASETKLTEARSSLAFAQRKAKEAEEERDAAGACLSQARSRFFNVIDEIEPLPIPHIFGKPVDRCNGYTERPF